MKPELEKYLWDEMHKNGFGNPYPRDVIEEMFQKGMIKSKKQAWRTLEKWADKDLYSWRSIMDLGRKT